MSYCWLRISIYATLIWCIVCYTVYILYWPMLLQHLLAFLECIHAFVAYTPQYVSRFEYGV